MLAHYFSATWIWWVFVLFSNWNKSICSRLQANEGAASQSIVLYTLLSAFGVRFDIYLWLCHSEPYFCATSQIEFHFISFCLFRFLFSIFTPLIDLSNQSEDIRLHWRMFVFGKAFCIWIPFHFIWHCSFGSFIFIYLSLVTIFAQVFESKQFSANCESHFWIVYKLQTLFDFTFFLFLCALQLANDMLKQTRKEEERKKKRRNNRIKCRSFSNTFSFLLLEKWRKHMFYCCILLLFFSSLRLVHSFRRIGISIAKLPHAIQAYVTYAMSKVSVYFSVIIGKFSIYSCL